jgi:hypothetical protein
MAHHYRKKISDKIRYFNYQNNAFIVLPDGWGFRIVPLMFAEVAPSCGGTSETIERFLGGASPEGNTPAGTEPRERTTWRLT